jgi:thiol-disulfide isomerase/thioredoxin
MKLKITVVFVLIAGVFLYFVFKGGYFGSGTQTSPVADQKPSGASLVDQISKMELRTYTGDKLVFDLAGAQHSEKVVIHLWASWCGPCVNEVPELVEFSKNRKDVKFIIVSLDDYKEDIEKFLKSFPEFNSKDYVQVWDVEKRISQLLNADRLPMSVLIDKNKAEPQFIKAVVNWKTLNF